MFHPQRIFILAPHTDDGELGCGASIAKYIQAGAEVYYIAFSSCSESLPEGLPLDTLVKECSVATQSLGILQQNLIHLNYSVRRFLEKRQEILEELIQLKRKYNPDTIFLPAQNDVHQDHQVIYAEGLRAFRNANLLGYELPWNNWRFQPNYFEKLSEDHLHCKINALQHYKSQAQKTYMNDSFIRSLATVRGIQAAAPLAEAFEIYHLNSR